MPQKTSDQLKIHRYFAADYPSLFTEITAKDYVSFVHSLYQKDFQNSSLPVWPRPFIFPNTPTGELRSCPWGTGKRLC